MSAHLHHALVLCMAPGTRLKTVRLKARLPRSLTLRVAPGYKLRSLLDSFTSRFHPADVIFG